MSASSWEPNYNDTVMTVRCLAGDGILHFSQAVVYGMPTKKGERHGAKARTAGRVIKAFMEQHAGCVPNEKAYTAMVAHDARVNAPLPPAKPKPEAAEDGDAPWGSL